MELKFDEKGLIPAIVQDHYTKQVLTLAYMNAETLALTIAEGRTVFWSRSRQEIWRKGETSGNVQRVVSITADCDADALVVEVVKDGPACHTGAESCFFNEVYVSPELKQFSWQGLYELIKGRKDTPTAGSYTTYLFEKGKEKILKKVGEECTEVIIAGEKEDKEETVYEISDLAYHVLVLMFTSGTTGRSKGVMLCERNFFAVMPHHVRVGQRFCQLKNDPDLLVSHMTLLPMFHLGAFGCLFTWAWMGWAQNLGSLRSFYKDLKRMPSQDMAAVPVLVQSIHHDLMTGKQDKLGDLWALNCMSAMFDPQTLMDLHDHGMVISQLYGSTETTGGGLINFAEDAKHIGSIGKDDGHCEIKLDNGELCMRGGDVMLGYYKDPEGTAEVVDAEGWFHTGDLARVDEDGYYFLTGRKKNVIILDSGENVSPEELEGLLAKCPAVKECLVKEKGKKICAVVCCEEADQQAVRDFITETNRTLPLYKRMSAVEFSAQPLPRNAMGKLMR